MFFGLFIQIFDVFKFIILEFLNVVQNLEIGALLFLVLVLIGNISLILVIANGVDEYNHGKLNLLFTVLMLLMGGLSGEGFSIALLISIPIAAYFAFKFTSVFIENSKVIYFILFNFIFSPIFFITYLLISIMLIPFIR